MIDALPTGRSFQNLSVLVPGVQIGARDRRTSAAPAATATRRCRVHGSRADQMPLVMNGMPYNNMNNTGGGYNTTLVINTGTVQEMTVTTSGLSAEARSSGVLTQHRSRKKAATRSAGRLRQLRERQLAERTT